MKYQISDLTLEEKMKLLCGGRLAYIYGERKIASVAFK